MKKKYSYRLLPLILFITINILFASSISFDKNRAFSEIDKNERKIQLEKNDYIKIFDGIINNDFSILDKFWYKKRLLIGIDEQKHAAEAFEYVIKKHSREEKSIIVFGVSKDRLIEIEKFLVHIGMKEKIIENDILSQKTSGNYPNAPEFLYDYDLNQILYLSINKDCSLVFTVKVNPKS